jgi:hypothetical protein
MRGGSSVNALFPEKTSYGQNRIAKLASRQHALLAKAEESGQVVRSLTFVSSRPIRLRYSFVIIVVMAGF